MKQRIAAITTYAGISLNARFLISVTIPVIPLKKHWSLLIFLISVRASIASSDDVVLSNSTSIMVASPLKNASRRSFGIISTGRLKSATSSYQRTSLTWSISLYASSSFCTSFSSIFSTTTMENAPIPYSSTIISWPLIVSSVSGR